MSSNEYPEHLNPFKDGTKPKSKLGLRSSFSRLTRPLRQSFRKIIKDDHNNDVTIRKKRTDDFPRYSYSTSTQNLTPALPRSRFRDRLTNSYSENAANPFDDDQDESTLDIDSLQRNTLRRRTKKKAPLPPKSLSNDHLNDSSLHPISRASNWSLTSAETDYSEEPEQALHSQETSLPLDEVIEITKGLEKLIDDSNNNIVVGEKQNEIPDIVVSCANSCDSSKTTDNKQAVIRRLSEAEIQDSSLGTHLENKSIIIENGNNKEVGESSGENDDDDDDELVVTDITHNLIQDENKNTPNGDVDNTCGTNEEHRQTADLNYNERKSIYISGSRDELNNSDSYCDKISIYINNSIEAIDKANNNNKKNANSNSNSEEDVADSGAPVPKLRKNKLTKRELLGGA